MGEEGCKGRRFFCGAEGLGGEEEVGSSCNCDCAHILNEI